ncbi:hypothetical protein [Burkholderia sp. AU18528]|uniref:hypothetical protein n=1 Tax=Burkholderia sp. AU18528 TaxID=2015350 RepID=UPI0015D48367|nr:hypothetical protein [Burkholderia sp. AU18528]
MVVLRSMLPSRGARRDGYAVRAVRFSSVAFALGSRILAYPPHVVEPEVCCGSGRPGAFAPVENVFAALSPGSVISYYSARAARAGRYRSCRRHDAPATMTAIRQARRTMRGRNDREREAARIPKKTRAQWYDWCCCCWASNICEPAGAG